ncbi:MAG: DUF3300 domain-containing protein [Pseudomonadota bacterium]|nr:MAG: DUF3300 domain-containing protein [Pseudomonadota bacterium]
MNMYRAVIIAVLLVAGLAVSNRATAEEPLFTQAELDQMLAPVALYPDSVLSHVLIAATYPLEVVQAARWLRERPGLRGEEAVRAAAHMGWDASVQALTAFPELLARMDADLDWTQRLGDAFLYQEQQVADSVQYLRSQAYAQGHLRSNDYVRVVRETRYIYIEPAQTRVVYVPYYDPRVVYTHWRWAAYPPVWWHRPSDYVVRFGFYWGSGHLVATSFFHRAFHWPRRQVVVHHHHHHYDHSARTIHSGRQLVHAAEVTRWRHDPQHRRGVQYRAEVHTQRLVSRDQGVGRGSRASIRHAAGGDSQVRATTRNRASAAASRASATRIRSAAASASARQRSNERSSARSYTSSTTARRSSQTGRAVRGDNRPSPAVSRQQSSRSRHSTDSADRSTSTRRGSRQPYTSARSAPRDGLDRSIGERQGAASRGGSSRAAVRPGNGTVGRTPGQRAPSRSVERISAPVGARPDSGPVRRSAPRGRSSGPATRVRERVAPRSGSGHRATASRRSSTSPARAAAAPRQAQSAPATNRRSSPERSSSRSIGRVGAGSANASARSARGSNERRRR